MGASGPDGNPLPHSKMNPGFVNVTTMCPGTCRTADDDEQHLLQNTKCFVGRVRFRASEISYRPAPNRMGCV